jgi:cytochrome c oxidase subunit III
LNDSAATGYAERFPPRTTDARTTDEILARARERRGRPTAWWGMVMFIAAESALFGSLIASYVYLRFQTPRWPPLGVPEPTVAVPVALTVVLAATSVPFLLATRAVRAGRLTATWGLVAAALLVQAGYVAYAVHDFDDRLSSFTPQTHAYGSIYFVLLGADLAHVAVGILLDLWLLQKLVRGLTTYRLNALQAIALYWYAVIVLTVCVTVTLLSARL